MVKCLLEEACIFNIDERVPAVFVHANSTASAAKGVFSNSKAAGLQTTYAEPANPESLVLQSLILSAKLAQQERTRTIPGKRSVRLALMDIIRNQAHLVVGLVLRAKPTTAATPARTAQPANTANPEPLHALPVDVDAFISFGDDLVNIYGFGESERE